jgi:hypothetical protein
MSTLHGTPYREETRRILGKSTFLAKFHEVMTFSADLLPVFRNSATVAMIALVP